MAVTDPDRLKQLLAVQSNVDMPTRTDGTTPFGPPVDPAMATEPSAEVPPAIADVIGSGTDAPKVDAAPATPELAPQGSKHPFLHALERITGEVGPQPEAGKPYSGPTTPEAKTSARRNFLTNLGDRLTEFGATMGTPQQKEYASQLPLERQKARASQDLAKASLASLSGYRSGTLENNATKNDVAVQIASQKADVGALEHGLVPDEKNPGHYREITPDEVLSGRYPQIAMNREAQRASVILKQAQTDKANADAALINDPNNPTFIQHQKAIDAKQKLAEAAFFLAVRRANQGDERIAQGDQRIGMMGTRVQLAQSKAGLTAWQPALDSGQRLQVMRSSLTEAIANKDQQAMLNLLANHLGMTMGLQKGARMNQALISEAEKSRPWLQGMASKFDSDGYLTGVTLSPAQMHTMVALAEERYRTDIDKARLAAQYEGIDEEPMLPIAPDGVTPNPRPAAGPQGQPSINRGGGTPKGGALSESEALQYLQKAGGDKAKARALAKQDGRSF